MRRNVPVRREQRGPSEPFEAEVKKLRKQLLASERTRVDQTQALRKQVSDLLAESRRSEVRQPRTAMHVRPLTFWERLLTLSNGRVPESAITTITEITE